VDRVSGAGDSMFPDLPEPPQLVLTVAEGPWGGPSYSYRGARIECAPGGHVCGLFMPEHPLHGRNFGVAGTCTSLVDLWADTSQLPSYMRQGEGARHDRPGRHRP
jgi:hypothetical protein